MKKILKLLSIILACIMLVSCNNTEITTENTLDTTLQTTNSGEESRPMTLDEYFGAENFETLKNYIETRKYADEYPYIAEAYEYYHKDGYIYRPRHSEITESNAVNNNITRLQTHANYTDIGIWMRYKRGDGRIGMAVCHADESALAENRNIFGYCSEWLGLSHYEGIYDEMYEKDVTVEGKTTKAFFIKAGKDDIGPHAVYFFIDDTHYVYIEGFGATEAEVIEFISEITFEKVPLEKAE